MELNLFFKKILFTFIFSLVGIACFSLYGQEINLSKIKPIAQKVMNKYGDGVYFKEYNPFNQVEVKEAPNTKSDDTDKYLVTIDPQDLKSIYSSGERLSAFLFLMVNKRFHSCLPRRMYFHKIFKYIHQMASIRPTNIIREPIIEA
jgi:hypothetical protein